MTGEAIPDMEPGNAEIWQLLMIMNTQWLCGFGGIYGLNMQPVIESARDLEIDRDWEFFEKVKAFETEVLKHTGGRDKRCNKDKKEKCREMFGNNLEWACKHCEEKEGE